MRESAIERDGDCTSARSLFQNQRLVNLVGSKLMHEFSTIINLGQNYLKLFFALNID